MHGVLKRAGREQFGRLPYVANNGDVYYLDLLVWRCNLHLKKEPVYEEFCKALLFWTINPLEGWNRRVPIFEDESEEEGEREDLD